MDGGGIEVEALVQFIVSSASLCNFSHFVVIFKYSSINRRRLTATVTRDLDIGMGLLY